MRDYYEKLYTPGVREQIAEKLARGPSPAEILEENLKQAAKALPELRMVANSSFVSRADRRAAQKVVVEIEDLLRESKVATRRTAAPASKA